MRPAAENVYSSRDTRLARSHWVTGVHLPRAEATSEVYSVFDAVTRTISTQGEDGISVRWSDGPILPLSSRRLKSGADRPHCAELCWETGPK